MPSHDFFEWDRLGLAVEVIAPSLLGDREVLNVAEMLYYGFSHDVDLGASRPRRELLEASFQFRGQFESEHVTVP
jgi:hypothetical protein